jgi:hypothetical protein
MPRYLSSESTSTNGTSSGTGSSSITPVSLGGTGANTATSALLNLGATTFGIQILSSVDAAAVNTLLGNTGSSGTTSTSYASQTDLNTEINNRISGDNALNASLTTVSTIANAALPSAVYTAADVFAKVKSLDGSGSGLDADTVRGFIPVQQGTGVGQLPNVVKVGWDGTQLKVTVDATDLGGIALKSDLTKVINPSKITYLSESGHNVMAMVMDGKLYTSAGNSTAYDSTTTGRHANADGYDTGYGVNNFAEVNIPNTSGIKKVGGFHRGVAYALMNDGSLYTWGYNNNGECGLGHTNVVPLPTLAAVGVVDAYKQPVGGGFDITTNFFVILKNDGYLYGTGYNGNGQLGLGDTTNRTSFTLMSWVGTNPKNVFVLGNYLGCLVVLTSDGRIKVAGYNSYGQLGNGNNSSQLTGLDVTNAWAGVASGVLSVKASGGFGYYDTVANYSSTLVMMITLPNSTNIVKASGCNTWGGLGNGGTTNTNIPVSVLNSTNVVDIACFGGGPVTCQMLKSDGTLWAWGHNSYGQVGNGNINNTPTPIQVLSNVATLLSNGSNSHTWSYRTQAFVILTDGSLWVTGYNNEGYCGTGKMYDVTVGSGTIGNTTFHRVLLPLDETAVMMGHSCQSGNGRILLCLTAKGNLYGWGYNGYNALIGESNRSCNIPQVFNLPRRNT